MTKMQSRQLTRPNNTFYCKKCFYSGPTPTCYSFTESVNVVMTVDNKCQVCVGTGIVPIPLSEIMK